MFGLSFSPQEKDIVNALGYVVNVMTACFWWLPVMIYVSKHGPSYVLSIPGSLLCEHTSGSNLGGQIELWPPGRQQTCR